MRVASSEWLRVVLGVLLLGACSRGRSVAPQPAPLSRPLSAFLAEQLDVDLQLSPSVASWLGDHSADDQLEDLRPESLLRQVIQLQQAITQLRAYPEPAGTPLDLERALVLARLETRLFDLAELHLPERSPLFYAHLIAHSLDVLLGPRLITRPGLRALRARLSALPALCRQAQRSLKNPPEIWTRRAVEVLLSTREVLHLILPRLLANASISDPLFFDDLTTKRQEADRALDELGTYLSRDLLPRSRGDWTLGRERLLRRLALSEQLTVSLDTLEAHALLRLTEAHTRIAETQARATPPRSLADLWRQIEDDHPRPEDLLSATRDAVDRAYEQTQAAGFLPLAHPRLTKRPDIAELPAYRLGPLLLQTSAPLDPVLHATFFVDPVDTGWRDKRLVQDHLRLLNHSQLALSALREVMPGHYAQHALATENSQKIGPGRLRNPSQFLVAGWPAYVEYHLAIDAPALTPQEDRVRLLALRMHILRLARLVATLRLHAPPALAPATSPAQRLDDVVAFLAEQALLDDYTARREAERLTYDPMALSSALGFLLIDQLVLDAKARQGAHFDRAQFHAQLLSLSALPIPLLRTILLGDHSAELPSQPLPHSPKAVPATSPR